METKRAVPGKRHLHTRLLYEYIAESGERGEIPYSELEDLIGEPLHTQKNPTGSKRLRDALEMLAFSGIGWWIKQDGCMIVNLGTEQAYKLFEKGDGTASRRVKKNKRIADALPYSEASDEGKALIVEATYKARLRSRAFSTHADAAIRKEIVGASNLDQIDYEKIVDVAMKRTTKKALGP